MMHEAEQQKRFPAIVLNGVEKTPKTKKRFAFRCKGLFSFFFSIF
jgi:hypothetical protein